MCHCVGSGIVLLTVEDCRIERRKNACDTKRKGTYPYNDFQLAAIDPMAVYIGDGWKECVHY